MVGFQNHISEILNRKILYDPWS